MRKYYGDGGASPRCPWAAAGTGCETRARPRCRWAAAGPGRASRSTTPSRRLACSDLTGGPPPTGTHSGPAHRTGRAAAGDQAVPQAAQEPLNGIAKGAGISRPLARAPSLIHEGHLDAAH